MNERIIVSVTPELRKTFRQVKVKGKGGFQGLTRNIQASVKSQKRITFDRGEFVRLIRYSTDYGHGGYQQAFRFLIALAVKQHHKDLF